TVRRPLADNAVFSGKSAVSNSAIAELGNSHSEKQVRFRVKGGKKRQFFQVGRRKTGKLNRCYFL
ncbi:MAG: hypothetical protein ACE5FZ_08100, partial [Nitrospiria bacterium]